MKEETVDVCNVCNEPTESITWEDEEEVCYGHGRITTEYFECKGSQCCHADIYEMSLDEYSYDWPNKALEFGLIDTAKHAEILEELEELE